MKYLKSYEKFKEVKQLSLFPEMETDKAQDVTKTFVQHFKTNDESDTSTRFETSKEVLDYFDNDEGFNRVCRILIDDGGNMIDEYDYRYAAIHYFDNNCDILIDYLKDTGDFGEYFDVINEEDRLEKTEEYVKNNRNVDVEKMVGDYDEFIKYTQDNYSQYFDFTRAIDNQYWDELTYSLRHNVENDKMPIYRSVTIPKSIKDLKKVISEYSGVGVYWTFDEEKPEPYGAYSNQDSQEIVLKAWVRIKDVDWETTFERTIYSLREEREINVISGSVVELFEIHLKDKEDDIMKNLNFKYFEETYGFDWSIMNKIKNSYKIDAKDKSTMIFEPTIKIKA